MHYASLWQKIRKRREETTEQLDFIPAKAQVIQHLRYKYACKSCEETIKTAKSPKHPIPKSIASAGLLAQLHMMLLLLMKHRFRC